MYDPQILFHFASSASGKCLGQQSSLTSWGSSESVPFDPWGIRGHLGWKKPAPVVGAWGALHEAACPPGRLEQLTGRLLLGWGIAHLRAHRNATYLAIKAVLPHCFPLDLKCGLGAQASLRSPRTGPVGPSLQGPVGGVQ